MYESMEKVIREDMETEINNSPFGIYGLELDEATDSSNASFLVIYVRYINPAGDVVSRFHGAKVVIFKTFFFIIDNAVCTSPSSMYHLMIYVDSSRVRPTVEPLSRTVR